MLFLQMHIKVWAESREASLGPLRTLPFLGTTASYIVPTAPSTYQNIASVKTQLLVWNPQTLTCQIYGRYVRNLQLSRNNSHSLY